MTDELTLTGRIPTASNATFVGTLGELTVVYKPTAGEKPLWDFPGNDLARREFAAYLVSESFGWNVVPRTWLGEGPHGSGMLQLWQDADPEQDAVDLLPTEQVPEHGWRVVFDGTDGDDRPVSLVHEDTAVLRRMAVFDIVVNNADRKGAHVLAMSDGHRYGVDHGLTFHVEHKLRTVLWGWIGEELTTDERAGVERVRADLNGSLGTELGALISAEEIEVLGLRCDRLLRRGVFPAPRGDMPAVPWPLF